MKIRKTDETILEHIKALARDTDAKLFLFHVADGFVARNQKSLNLTDSPEMKEDRLYLESKAQDLSNNGFSATYHLACGEPALKIREFAESNGCDLIAMATHGHKLVGDIVFGSVADKLRHATSIPILMVKASKN